MKFIPIILSFLYGKRYAGMISLTLALSFRIYEGHSGVGLAAASMLIYCVPPFFVSKRMDTFSTLQKLAWCVGLSFFATADQISLIFVYFNTVHAGHAWTFIHPYLVAIVAGSLVQVLLMVPATLVLEQILFTGKSRIELMTFQNSLRESEERYKSLIEYNPDGICLVDLDGNYLFVNEMYEKITGYSKEELVGHNRLKLWLEEDRGFASEIHQRVLNKEIVSNIEIEFLTKHGSKVPVRFTMLPMMTKGEVSGFFSIVADMRNIRRAEEAVRKADKLATVGELAAGIAHEIRNPLTTLKGFLKLLRSHDLTTERYVSIMEAEMERLDFISGQMLVLAKPQMETRGPNNLNQLVIEVASLMYTQAVLKDIEMVNTVNIDPPMIGNVDQNQMKQVLLNVIKNAIEATPKGGIITVSTKPVGNHAVISVADTGVGIPESMLARLGEPFYSTKGTGTGLGLMVSHRIIENHNGVIRYQSTEGAGTTVDIQVPLFTDSSSPLHRSHPELQVAVGMHSTH